MGDTFCARWVSRAICHAALSLTLTIVVLIIEAADEDVGATRHHRGTPMLPTHHLRAVSSVADRDVQFRPPLRKIVRR